MWEDSTLSHDELQAYTRYRCYNRLLDEIIYERK